MINAQRGNPLIPFEQLGDSRLLILLNAARFQADVVLARMNQDPNSLLNERFSQLTDQANLYRTYEQQVLLTERKKRLITAQKQALPKFADRMKMLNLII